MMEPLNGPEMGQIAQNRKNAKLVLYVNRARALKRPFLQLELQCKEQKVAERYGKQLY